MVTVYCCQLGIVGLGYVRRGDRLPDAGGGDRGAVGQRRRGPGYAGIVWLIEAGQGERSQLGEVLGQEEQAAFGELIVDGVDGSVVDEDHT